MTGGEDSAFREQADQATKGWDSVQFKRYNLAVLGATGVGKSTLINAVFGEKVARTGIGEPVTKGMHYYPMDDLGLYDFEGSESFQELSNFVKNFRRIYFERIEVDPSLAIHAVWFCIKASDRRFDSGQEQLLAELNALDVPVILVVTQTPYKKGLGVAPDAAEFIDHLNQRSLPIFQQKVVPVSAIADEFSGTEKFGLSELISVSKAAARDEGVKAAFENAQTADADSKSRQADIYIAAAAAAAGVAAASPIPGSDAPILVAIQATLMHKIARLFHVGLSASNAAAALVGMAGPLGGRFVAGQLAKLIPGAGQVINATVASSMTALFGHAWKQLCMMDWRGELDIAGLAEAGDLSKRMSDMVREAAKRNKETSTDQTGS